jgi:hypothetical protein
VRILLVDEDMNMKQKELRNEQAVSAEDCQAVDQGALTVIQFKANEFYQLAVEQTGEDADDLESWKVDWNLVEVTTSEVTG